MHSLDVTCSAGDNVLNLLLDGPKRMSELRKTTITLSALLCRYYIFTMLT